MNPKKLRKKVKYKTKFNKNQKVMFPINIVRELSFVAFHSIVQFGTKARPDLRLSRVRIRRLCILSLKDM